MSDAYENGELFVYVNGDRWELGMVKRPNNTGDGYFCWYSRGDTAANTPIECMHKLANSGWTHVEQTYADQACGLHVLVRDMYDLLLDWQIGIVDAPEARGDLSSIRNRIKELGIEVGL